VAKRPSYASRSVSGLLSTTVPGPTTSTTSVSPACRPAAWKRKSPREW
jgi:hypothetical protein